LCQYRPRNPAWFVIFIGQRGAAAGAFDSLRWEGGFWVKRSNFDDFLWSEEQATG
jgi:hypothetical protein